jgi:hypothetical protein
MKIKDLIKILSEYDQDQEVITFKTDGNIRPIMIRKIELGTKKQIYYDEEAELRSLQLPTKANGVYTPVIQTTYELGPNAGTYKALDGWNGGVKYDVERFDKYHDTKESILIH